ncbi:MAG TPA: hypothetical protein VG756_15845 [Pseudonocardiaceae bacterium]|nr:hypothetical protein [Pseudonocardiaceae bacterium]
MTTSSSAADRRAELLTHRAGEFARTALGTVRSATCPDPSGLS